MDESTCDFGFATYRLSLRERLLYGPDGHVALGSRAFDTLAVLVKGRGDIVSKDVLMNAVWPGVFVDENNLQVQISALRRALTGDVGQSFIQNVPGRGYRFAAKVTELPFDSPAASPAPATAEVLPLQAAASPDNLPAQLTPMIGRIDELAQALSLLESNRLVSLVGPGGVGKTKLALNTAMAALPRFEHGCWWIELGAVFDAAHIADSLSAALKIPDLPGRSLADGIIVWLRGRKLLLIFDNCEHLIAEIAEAVETLLQKCADTKILVTSQEPLGIEGERICRIEPFAVPAGAHTADAETALSKDAVRLFVERARAGDQRFELTDAMVPAVVEICQHLDGIPLALELAAARLPLLGLEPLRRRIANGLSLEDEGNRRGNVRHRTLRAAIEWSYNLCSPQDCRILRRLSVFVGGFTLDGALAIGADLDPCDDIVGGVSNLARRSLLTVGSDLRQPRYRMLQPMQSFAAEKLEEAGERLSVGQRHADHINTHFQQADTLWELTPRSTWLPPLVAETENLRAALNWSLGAGLDVMLGVRLAAAASRFWFECVKFAEGRQWLERALDLCPAEANPQLRLSLLRGMAALTHDAPLAVSTAFQAVELARQDAHRDHLGACLRTYAAALYRHGRYLEAETAATEALDLLDKHARPKTRAQCISDLCILRGVAGDLAAARRLNTDVQILSREVGDERGAAICLQYAAEFEFVGGNTDSALALAEDAAKIFRSLDEKFRLGIELGNIAAYALSLDNLPKARQAAREALVLAREIGDEAGVIIAVEHLALFAALSGNLPLAARLYGYSDHIYRSQDVDRQATERLGQERLAAFLVEKLGSDEEALLRQAGTEMSEAAAIAEALAL